VLGQIEMMLPSEGDLRTEFICDDSRGHYQIGQVGWEEDRRVDDIYIHVDVIGDKVWLQHDGTNLKVAELLVKEGVPRDAIVLAFHRPDLRVYTEYAAA
jgi:hypothetical protein